MRVSQVSRNLICWNVEHPSRVSCNFYFQDCLEGDVSHHYQRDALATRIQKLIVSPLSCAALPKNSMSITTHSPTYADGECRPCTGMTMTGGGITYCPHVRVSSPLRKSRRGSSVIALPGLIFNLPWEAEFGRVLSHRVYKPPSHRGLYQSIASEMYRDADDYRDLQFQRRTTVRARHP